MEHIALCCVVPHPPIMVPEVGGQEARRVSASIDAMRLLGREISEISPDSLVIMSPHSPAYSDAFTARAAPRMSGSLATFGAPGVRTDTHGDLELAAGIAREAASRGIRCEATGGNGPGAGGASELDHGVLVPMYFLAQRPYPLVCLSLSYLDMNSHYLLGIAVREAAGALGKRCVFVASGDMSHRLLPSSPAGYSPRGAEFDRRVVEIMESGNYSELLEIDPELVADAGECGLRSIITMAGVLDGYGRSGEVLSYEGPFGVGYMVARIKPLEKVGSFPPASEGD